MQRSRVHVVVLLQEAAILGLLSFVMSLVVLIFFSSVLLNVVDAVFMCYAMDLDTQSVTKSEVHEVFSQVRYVRFYVTTCCLLLNKLHVSIYLAGFDKL